MSFRLSACISTAPTECFLWNFVLGTSMNICWEIPNLTIIWQKHRTLHIETAVSLYCGQQHTILRTSRTVQRELIPAFPCQHIMALCFWQIRVAQGQYKGKALLRTSNNNGYPNVPQYLFIRILLSRCIIMPSQVSVRTGPILSCFPHQNFFSPSSVPQVTSFLYYLTWLHNYICYEEKIIKLLIM